MIERTQFFIKIYLSYFILKRVAKGLCVKGELETKQTATYWPPVPLTIAALLFSFCWAAQPGGDKPSAGSWFSLPWTATQTSTGTDAHLLLVATTITPNSTRQGDTLISSTGCTCFLIDGWVEGQYVTKTTLHIVSISLSNWTFKPWFNFRFKSSPFSICNITLFFFCEYMIWWRKSQFNQENQF